MHYQQATTWKTHLERIALGIKADYNLENEGHARQGQCKLGVSFDINGYCHSAVQSHQVQLGLRSDQGQIKKDKF